MCMEMSCKKAPLVKYVVYVFCTRQRANDVCLGDTMDKVSSRYVGVLVHALIILQIHMIHIHYALATHINRYYVIC